MQDTCRLVIEMDHASVRTEKAVDETSNSETSQPKERCLPDYTKVLDQGGNAITRCEWDVLPFLPNGSFLYTPSFAPPPGLVEWVRRRVSCPSFRAKRGFGMESTHSTCSLINQRNLPSSYSIEEHLFSLLSPSFLVRFPYKTHCKT